MKTIVLIVIGLLVITLLVLAFCKKKTKTDTDLHPVTAYNPTSREYDYRQQENLVEQSDTKYTVPTQEVQQIELTRYAVEHASSRAKAVIRINQAFFNKLKNTYAQAYILYMNGNAANAKSRNYRYLKSLYYRSVEAGARLHAAEKECQQAVAALQRSSSGESALIKSVGQCQSMIAKLRISVWNNTHTLKLYIRDSGPEGRAWYNALEKKHKEKYGK